MWRRGSDASGWGFAVVVPDGFDIVPIRVIHEGGVVARPVVPIAGLAIVLRARGERGLVEGFDLTAVLRFERDVRRHDRLVLRDPEVGVLAVVEAGGFSVLHVIPV